MARSWIHRIHKMQFIPIELKILHHSEKPRVSAPSLNSQLQEMSNTKASNGIHEEVSHYAGKGRWRPWILCILQIPNAFGQTCIHIPLSCKSVSTKGHSYKPKEYILTWVNLDITWTFSWKTSSWFCMPSVGAWWIPAEFWMRCMCELWPHRPPWFRIIPIIAMMRNPWSWFSKCKGMTLNQINSCFLLFSLPVPT